MPGSRQQLIRRCGASASRRHRTPDIDHGREYSRSGARPAARSGPGGGAVGEGVRPCRFRAQGALAAGRRRPTRARSTTSMPNGYSGGSQPLGSTICPRTLQHRCRGIGRLRWGPVRRSPALEGAGAGSRRPGPRCRGRSARAGARTRPRIGRAALGRQAALRPARASARLLPRFERARAAVLRRGALARAAGAILAPKSGDGPGVFLFRADEVHPVVGRRSMAATRHAADELKPFI